MYLKKMTKFVIFLFMEIMSKKANETSHTWTRLKKYVGIVVT